MAKKPRIEKKATVLKTEVTLQFTDTDGKDHIATIIRNVKDPNDWKISVDNRPLKAKTRALNEFLFCEEDKKGNVTIGGKQYSCHVVKAASEGTFLLGNRSCPYFLNPPGIWINL
jgi:hypothetical protein